MNLLSDCQAPAKLNLFLHVTGQRSDGHHLLQTAFALINLVDVLHIETREDSAIEIAKPLPGVPVHDDLVWRAARLMQKNFGVRRGARITVEKHIPMGGGLGGGSSDAATTMLALNRLWKLHAPRATLMKLGLALGADVPFFLFGQNAWAAGIGEELIEARLGKHHFAVIHPGVSVPTGEIFAAAELTRNTPPIKIPDFCAGPGIRQLYALGGSFGCNDLQPVATALYPAVGRALKWLGQFGPALMSGSGACVFCVVNSRQAAQDCVSQLPEDWVGWACESLPEHPHRHWATD